MGYRRAWHRLPIYATSARCCSVLVSRFLDNPRATHLMFIDADIAFEPEQFLRLLRHGKDFLLTEGTDLKYGARLLNEHMGEGGGPIQVMTGVPRDGDDG